MGFTFNVRPELSIVSSLRWRTLYLRGRRFGCSGLPSSTGFFRICSDKKSRTGETYLRTLEGSRITSGSNTVFSRSLVAKWSDRQGTYSPTFRWTGLPRWTREYWMSKRFSRVNIYQRSTDSGVPEPHHYRRGITVSFFGNPHWEISIMELFSC